MSGIMDTRELVERAEEIEAELELVEGEDGEEFDPLEPEERKALQEELTEIQEISGYVTDFYNGEALIPESEFEDYARQLAEDIGAINSEADWPSRCIDWEQAANELQQDYTSVEYQGTTYLVRA
jgi:antirestriction protein